MLVMSSEYFDLFTDHHQNESNLQVWDTFWEMYFMSVNYFHSDDVFREHHQDKNNSQTWIIIWEMYFMSVNYFYSDDNFWIYWNIEMNSKLFGISFILFEDSCKMELNQYN